MVTRLGMDDWEIVAQFRAGARSFCVECAEWVWGPLVLLWISTGCSSPGVKRPECEANRSPSSSVEVNSDWNYTSVPPFVFMTCYGSISSLSHVIFFRFTSYPLWYQDRSWSTCSQCYFSWGQAFEGTFWKMRQKTRRLFWDVFLKSHIGLRLPSVSHNLVSEHVFLYSVELMNSEIMCDVYTRHISLF